MVPEHASRSSADVDAMSKAEAAVEKAKSELVEVADEIKEEVSEVVAELKEEASELVDEAKSAATGDDAGKKKKKGWRKYYLFGPRVGGD